MTPVRWRPADRVVDLALGRRLAPCDALWASGLCRLPGPLRGAGMSRRNSLIFALAYVGAVVVAYFLSVALQ